MIATVLWHWRMSFPFDDAYITFRYAANLASGHGLVWNAAGPHTEGYTNLLLVLLLSPFAIVHTDLLIVSQLIGIISTILTAIIIFKLTQSISGSKAWPLIAGIFYLLLPHTWTNTFSGLETSLFILLATSSFYFASQKKWSLSFLLVSAAALARPEGSIAGIILGISVFWENRSDRAFAIRAALGWFVLPMTLYASFKLWYFGDLLPNSFYIKTGEPGFHGIQNLKDFVRSNAVLTLVSIFSLLRYRENWKKVTLMLIWSASITLFYVWPELLQGFYFRFDWPAIPALVILTVIALARQKFSWRSILIVAIIVSSQIAISLPAVRRDMQLATIEQGRRIYRELGSALAAIPNHEQMSFAFQDAGAVPFYSGMNNIDLVGLNTTAIARAKTPLDACSVLEKSHPDIILIPAYHDFGECWEVFHTGHGKAGALVPVLIQHPLMQNYSCVGRITYLGYDILCYSLPDCFSSLEAQLARHSWFTAGDIPCLQ